METTETKQGSPLPTITLAMLEGACPDQRAIFKREWPEGAVLTLPNVRRAQELGLDLEWGRRWMSAPARKAYNEAVAPAAKAYNEATAPAEKAYNEAVAPAAKAYNEATAPSRQAYDEAVAPAAKAYNEATAPARKAYDEATAHARKAYDEATAHAWLRAMLESLAVAP